MCAASQSFTCIRLAFVLSALNDYGFPWGNNADEVGQIPALEKLTDFHPLSISNGEIRNVWGNNWRHFYLLWKKVKACLRRSSAQMPEISRGWSIKVEITTINWYGRAPTWNPIHYSHFLLCIHHITFAKALQLVLKPQIDFYRSLYFMSAGKSCRQSTVQVPEQLVHISHKGGKSVKALHIHERAYMRPNIENNDCHVNLPPAVFCHA